MIIGLLNALRILAAIALIIAGINRIALGHFAYGALDFFIAIFVVITIQMRRNA